jgi:hypothetical protein
MSRRDFACSVAVALLALGGGCKKKIGDPCLRSTDCSPRGDRSCDLSHRVNAQGVPTTGGKGECTVQGCGRGTCPKEGACVKVYGTDFLTVPCDPSREDLAVACADEITARTSCRRECKNNGDCRSGYSCRRTGQDGVYLAPDLDHPASQEQVKICMPVQVDSE